MSSKSSIKQIFKFRRLPFLLLAVASLGACNSTPIIQNTSVVDFECVSQAQNMKDHAELTNSHAQLFGAANIMQSCIPYTLPAGLDREQISSYMKVKAQTVLLYIEAGAIEEASNELVSFETQFPSRDLILPDFTSFVDTAKALLHSRNMSRSEIVSLNISRSLKQEINRQQHWSRN